MSNDGSAGVGLGGVGSGLAGGLHKDAGAAVLDWNARRVGLREVLRATGRLERFAFEFLAPTSGHALHVGIALAVEKVCRAPQLTRLVRLLGFPCTNTLMGLGGFPGTDPQFTGMLGMHGTFESNMAMQNCDVLLAVGARFDDRFSSTE